LKIGLTDLPGSAGRHLGTTPWLAIDRERLDQFEASTGSLDYLALSLTNYFLPQLLEVTGASSGVNYGAESALFGPPLAAGERVRGSAQVLTATAIQGGVQTVIRITVDVDGASEPACVVDSVSRWLA
jgi:hypothetical protein